MRPFILSNGLFVLSLRRLPLIATELLVNLKLVNKEFIDGLDQAESKVGGFSGAVKGLSNVGGSILAGAFTVAAAGATLLGVELYKDVQAAMDAEKIQAQLNAVLESTGGIAGVTAEQVNSLADSLSQVTPFEDEAIISGENMLLTFTNIGKDVFPQATETILDMSTALGQDLQSSAIQLGKALNDPVQGVTALRRVGVQLTDEQEAQVKAFMAVNDIAGAQQLILDELSREFGGSATEAGKTFAGQMTILQNKLGNIRESIGAKLLPALGQLATMFSEYINRPEVQAFIENFANSIAAFADMAIQKLPAVIGWFQQAFGWLQQNQGVIVAALAVISVAILAFIYTTVVPLVASMLPVIAIMAAVALVAYLLYQAWTTNFGGIQEKIAALIAWFIALKDNVMIVFENIKAVVTNAINFIKQVFEAAKAGDWYKVGELMRQAWDAAMKIIVDVVNKAWVAIKAAVSTLVKNVVNFIKNTNWLDVGANIIRGIANGVASGSSALSDALVNAVRNAISFVSGFLGIQSPSKLMAKLIGEPMGQGVIAGFASALNGSNLVPAFSGFDSPSVVGGGTGGGFGTFQVFGGNWNIDRNGGLSESVLGSMKT